jgi:RHS repeat-associated protein
LLGGGSASVATGYDLSGLRASHTDLLASGAWSANPAGETSQARGRPVVNDLLGRVTSLDGWNHAYSCDGLLLSSEPSSPSEGSRRFVHAYDALGRRVRTATQAYVGGQWAAFSATERDFLGKLPLGIETSFAGGSAKSWRFLRGPDASGTLEGAGGARGVLAVLKDDSSWKAVAADTLGNVLALAGTGGDFMRRTFDPWGNPLVRDASGNLRAATLQERRADYDALPLAWASQEADPDTGLTHYHFREYSPSLGGWMTQDPIGLAGGYLNLRSYLGNRPTDHFDVWGAWLGVDDAIAMGAGALVGVAVQGAVDLYHGKASSWKDYASVAVGGAAAGVTGLYSGGLASGAAYGAAANLTKQGLDNLDGTRSGFDAGGFAVETATGATLGRVGEMLAPSLAAGARRAGSVASKASVAESATAQAAAKAEVAAAAEVKACSGGAGSGVAETSATPRTTKDVFTRREKGGDGGTSVHIIEKDASSKTISKTHQVTTGGKVVHQHQDHIGQHGAVRRFPDSWVEYPEINESQGASR